jgi:hypothetical protein
MLPSRLKVEHARRGLHLFLRKPVRRWLLRPGYRIDVHLRMRFQESGYLLRIGAMPLHPHGKRNRPPYDDHALNGLMQAPRCFTSVLAHLYSRVPRTYDSSAQTVAVAVYIFGSAV